MQSCDSCDGLHVMSCDCRMAILQVAVGKFACQNCVVMRSGAYELFMLGSHSVSAVTLATWKQVDTHIQRPHTCVTCAHTCPSSSPTRVTSHTPSSSPTCVTSHTPSPSPTHVTSHPLSLSHTCYVTHTLSLSHTCYVTHTLSLSHTCYVTPPLPLPHVLRHTHPLALSHSASTRSCWATSP